MSPPPDLSTLSSTELRDLVIALVTRVSELERTVVAQREEIARLKGLSGRPTIKPSGMEAATQPKPAAGKDKQRRGGGKKTARRVIHEDRVIKVAAFPGSRFKGYEHFLVQDLVLRAHVIRYRRERWLTPDGQTITAALPAGIDGHFGPELRRFALAQHHQGQVTVARLLAQLRAISRRMTWRLDTSMPIARSCAAEGWPGR